MNKNKLLKESRIIKQEAEFLLKQSRLPKLLAQYGEVKIAGGYALDLMMNGDIDIHVTNPNFTKISAVNVLNDLIKRGFFKGYLFYDFIKFIKERKPGFPAGYYIGLKRRFRGRKWKIDIWFTKPKDMAKQDALVNRLKEGITNDNKYLILKFKKLKENRNLNIRSFEIYKMVLLKGIKTQKQFLAFVKNQRQS